jgi:hypothetical protein
MILRATADPLLPLTRAVPSFRYLWPLIEPRSVIVAKPALGRDLEEPGHSPETLMTTRGALSVHRVLATSHCGRGAEAGCFCGYVNAQQRCVPVHPRTPA